MKTQYSRTRDLLVDVNAFSADVAKKAKSLNITKSVLLVTNNISTGIFNDLLGNYMADKIGLNSRKELSSEQLKESRNLGLGLTSKRYWDNICEKLGINPDSYIIKSDVEQEPALEVEKQTSEPLDILNEVSELKKAIYDLGKVQLQSLEYLKKLVDVWSK